MKTNQEVFDKVARHLLTQGRKSETGHRCLYRCPDGASCAIGCLVDNEYYTPWLEHRGVSEAIVVDALRASGVDVNPNGVSISLLKELQHLHDMSEPYIWWDGLASTATVWGLSSEVLREFG